MGKLVKVISANQLSTTQPRFLVNHIGMVWYGVAMVRTGVCDLFIAD